jgi:hypothetical protein
MKKTITVISILAALSLVLACTSQPKPAPLAKAAADAPAAGTASAVPAAPKNLALGKEAASNNHIYEFTAGKAFDGDVNTYFEGAAKAYPNILTVDLGAKKDISLLVLKLNPRRIWSARTQTIEFQTSGDGVDFASALAAKAYDFDPESKNELKVPLNTNTRFIRLVFSANSESNAGQLAELEVFGQ